MILYSLAVLCSQFSTEHWILVFATSTVHKMTLPITNILQKLSTNQNTVKQAAKVCKRRGRRYFSLIHEVPLRKLFRSLRQSACWRSKRVRRLLFSALLLAMFRIFLLIAAYSTTSSANVEEGDKFPIFWNVPSWKCFHNGIQIPLSQYNIRHNKNQSFFGSEIVIFYEYKFGIFPYFKNGNSLEPVNGGLPQLCSLSLHLSAVYNHIITRIPEESFDGLAVIDFEEWRPLYQLNWGTKKVYQRESIRLVRKREPGISYKSAKRIAIREFNRAARKIFLETIKLGMRLRPYAKWGFYGFPYCNYDAGKEGETKCTEHFQQHNDELSFITNSGSAIFPSIYLGDDSQHQNFRYIQAILSESRRVSAFVKPSLPIYPYTKFEYDPYDPKKIDEFYTKRDLCSSVKQSSDLGAAGVVLWSTSNNMDNARCEYIRNFVDTQLGPIISLTKRRADRCSRKKCNGRGRCILDEPTDRCYFSMASTNYRCQCEPQYTGSTCSKHAHFPWLYANNENSVLETDEESDDVFQS